MADAAVRATKSREGRTSVLFSVTTETDGGSALGGGADSEQPATIKGVQTANKTHQICLNGERLEKLCISIPCLISGLDSAIDVKNLHSD